MSVNITSAYSGEVLQHLLVKATTGNALVKGKHVRVVPNISKDFYIPRLKMGKMLQKRKEMPTSDDSKGSAGIDERKLTPQDFMAYWEFNPKMFEHIWKKWQPEGPMVFLELNPIVQNQLLAEIGKVVDFELGGYFIDGVFGSGDNQLFNGAITVVAADSETVKVDSPVALTVDNIKAKYQAVYDTTPVEIRNREDFKIFTSLEDLELYNDSIRAQSTKGIDITDPNVTVFKGKKLVALPQWPKDVVMATYSSSEISTNLWVGVGFVTDEEVVQIDKVQANGEKYFIKMLMKADTNTAWGEDVVLYDART